MPSVVHPPSSDFPHFPLVRYPSHREGRNTAAMTGLAVLIVFDDFFGRGSPGNADWEGRKADSTGIGPVHLEWTIVDEGGGGWSRAPS